MSLKIENFLGHELIIPQDRQYDLSEELWMKEDGDVFVCGLTEPTVLMAGPIRDIELLVEDGAHVEAGETVLLLLTARLRYIASPISGTLHLPPDRTQWPDRLVKDPYETPLFLITADSKDRSALADPATYAQSLKNAEGARNPGGHKGGASPTCKAVYMGLGQQKLGNG